MRVVELETDPAIKRVVLAVRQSNVNRAREILER